MSADQGQGTLLVSGCTVSISALHSPQQLWASHRATAKCGVRAHGSGAGSQQRSGWVRETFIHYIR